jgi:nucleoside 2-deoxyribosyltransferase
MPKLKTIKQLKFVLERDGRPVAYLAGKVTGLPPQDVAINFFKAQLLFEKDNQIINPVAIVHPECDWKEAMRICLSLLPKADLVVALPNWKDSEGATWEVEVAKRLGIPVTFLSKI